MLVSFRYHGLETQLLSPIHCCFSGCVSSFRSWDLIYSIESFCVLWKMDLLGLWNDKPAKAHRCKIQHTLPCSLWGVWTHFVLPLAVSVLTMDYSSAGTPAILHWYSVVAILYLHTWGKSALHILEPTSDRTDLISLEHFHILTLKIIFHFLDHLDHSWNHHPSFGRKIRLGVLFCF